ncbi:hypothetical protein V8C86DRAFT_1586674 [Haematococcus lacustris]
MRMSLLQPMWVSLGGPWVWTSSDVNGDRCNRQPGGASHKPTTHTTVVALCVLAPWMQWLRPAHAHAVSHQAVCQWK